MTFFVTLEFFVVKKMTNNFCSNCKNQLEDRSSASQSELEYLLKDEFQSNLRSNSGSFRIIYEIWNALNRKKSCDSCGKFLLSSQRGLGQNAKFAGFWVRFLALFLEISVVALATFGIYYVANQNILPPFILQHTFFLTLIPLVLFLIHKAFSSTSFGKKIFGIKVGNAKDGSALLWHQSLNRFCTMSFCIGSGVLAIASIFAILFTKEKQSIHDLICNSRVFSVKK